MTVELFSPSEMAKEIFDRLGKQDGYTEFCEADGKGTNFGQAYILGDSQSIGSRMSYTFSRTKQINDGQEGAWITWGQPYEGLTHILLGCTRTIEDDHHSAIRRMVETNANGRNEHLLLMIDNGTLHTSDDPSIDHRLVERVQKLNKRSCYKNEEGVVYRSEGEIVTLTRDIEKALKNLP